MKFTIPKVNNTLYIGLLCMIFKVFLSSSIIIPYNNIADSVLTVLSTVFLTIEIIRKKTNILLLFIYAALGIFALYSTSLSGSYMTMITLLTIIAMQDSDIDNVISLIFKFEFMLLIAHTVYSLISTIIFRTPIGIFNSGVFKFHFGLSHPNLLGIYCFNLIAMWVWLNYKKINITSIAIILCIELLIFFFTASDTSLICTLALLLLLCIKKKSSSKKIINIAAKAIVPITSVLYIFLTINYTNNNTFSLLVDNLITGRIKLSAFAYENLGMSLFGKYVPDSIGYWDSTWNMQIFKFDNLYMYCGVELGIIWLILLVMAFYRLATINDDKINIFIIIWAFYGITEAQGLNAFLFFPPLLLSLLSSKKLRLDTNKMFIN